jgi:hypothetical protein
VDAAVGKLGALVALPEPWNAPGVDTVCVWTAWVALEQAARIIERASTRAIMGAAFNELCFVLVYISISS